ncbi:uncharacterized [Tachysurus ichikawai]
MKCIPFSPVGVGIDSLLRHGSDRQQRKVGLPIEALLLHTSSSLEALIQKPTNHSAAHDRKLLPYESRTKEGMMVYV